MYNQENVSNSEQIYKVIKSIYGESQACKVVDVCCGSFNYNGTNYDPNGNVYQPLVANYLGQKGLDVDGIDLRSNPTGLDLGYTHLSDINILESDWTTKLDTKFDSLLFLRSWDTPEILLYYQKKLDIRNLNKLCLEIANIYLPQFKKLIKPNGLFFTTDICNFGICGSDLEIQAYQDKIDKLLLQNGFQEIYSNDGLYGYKNVGD